MYRIAEALAAPVKPSRQSQCKILSHRFSETQLPFPVENIYDENRQTAQVLLLTADTRQLSAGHARALVPILDDKLQTAAAKEVVEKGLSVRQTEQLAARLLKEPEQPKPEEGIRVDYAAEVANRLSLSLGRKVKLIDGKKIGRIEIEFYGADDREALIEALEKLK